MNTRIVLVDDHQLYRWSTRAWLDSEAGLQVVGEAADGPTARRLVAELLPDVVITDVVLPQQSGIETTRHIVAEYPAVKVLALSLHADPSFVAAMIEAGASGYVLKENARQELVAAIHAVVNGGNYFIPAASGGAER